MDLSRLANGESSPYGVICEIMNDDGSMARFNDLVKQRKDREVEEMKKLKEAFKKLPK